VLAERGWDVNAQRVLTALSAPAAVGA
jgi:hypothetical protein